MKRHILLAVLALVINGIFLYFYNPYYYYSITQLHGQVGYNLCTHGTCDINPALREYMGNQVEQLGTLVDYTADVFANNQETVIHGSPFPINDTVGYGVILGLLWKLTGSFTFFDVQLLQIILFALLMPLAFSCARILFGSATIAWWCCIAQLFFFPLIAMNVQPVRDIWAYYGLILLLYGMLAYVFENKPLWLLMLCGAGFTVCQWVRPSVFAAYVLLCALLSVYAWFSTAYRARIRTAVVCLCMVTFMGFWAPFMAYNKLQYNRYFVGPVGQDLLEGLGEFENPWGFKLSDEFVNEHVSKKYGTVYGTPEFDDDAKKEFALAYSQNPIIFYTNMVKRIPQLALPGLPWIYYNASPYATGISWQKKLKIIFSNWSLFLDFVARHVYIRLFLLLGYLGIGIALIQKRYFTVALLLIGIIIGAWGKLPSHIEYRYLVPFYWVFSWFVGYLFAALFRKDKRYLTE